MTRLCSCGKTRGEIEVSATKVVPEDTQQRYTCSENICNYCIEFCSGGTIHGIRYIGENRTWIEKVWWLISIGVSLYFCIQLIIATYVKWDTSPVIVSFATKETPAWMVPFPAVTICPEAKVRPSAFNYTKYYDMKLANISLEPEIETKLGYASFLCGNTDHINFTSNRLVPNNEILDFFAEIQPKFFEDASDCKYQGKRYNCSEIFVPVITDDGLCYTFNIVDRTQLFSDSVVHYKNYQQAPITDDWTLEFGYSKSAGVETYPRRTLYSGVPFALEVKLAVYEDDLDYTCGAFLEGFKVQISHPQRVPRVKMQHFVVPLDRVSKAAVAPDMMTTSQSVQNYAPSARNCYLPSERSLRFFKVYSQSNCVVECRTNYTFNRCGCVDFYSPREESMPICGAGSSRCIRQASNDMRNGVMEKKILEFNTGKKIKTDDLVNCKCLPICTSMYYNVETSQTPWKFFDNQNTNRTKHMSMLQVFFKGKQFITRERNELYGFTDFLANVGGLLGLFIGFSALSFVEIVYYATLRVWCNVAMYGKSNWSGSTN